MSLSQLPRELRDTIYDYYTSENGGYYFDPREGKLRTLCGDKIDLSLMYTCKSFAAEMRGVPFRNNTIHFTTSPSPDRYNRDYRHFGHLLERLYAIKIMTLSQARPFITDEIARKTIQSFPHFATLIRHLRTSKAEECGLHEQLGRSVEWGSAPSVHHDAIAELLSMVAQNPAFGQAIREELFDHGCEIRDGQDVLSLYSLRPKPWCAPNAHEIQTMVQHMPSYRHPSIDERVRDQTRYSVSAASLASEFLSTLTQRSRSSIRHLELHELHASFAYSECHARALIPFVIENPKLKIVRRVDLWNNVLASQHLRDFEWRRYICSKGRTPIGDMDADEVTRTLALWLTEALALEPAGMPPKTFSLAFQGEKDSMQPIFDILLEDASWQAALEKFPGKEIGSVDELERSGTGYRGFSSYFFDELPELMRHIINGTAPVTFDYCSGLVWDVRNILTMNNTCHGMADWNKKWRSLRYRKVTPSLPHTWQTILENYVCKDEEARSM
ncbi:hypothetical protein GT037_004129 [Alternaria burnsii]|uniref:Uncharacterized protein n=1 Tax=Alternaria burnsii TaxID=1187904 RepID=A0A8H7B8X9_9PLEO|nr:uncharacterized protein GT037_004129 [Alternaria burnsii]KAF7678748.1 hypothetical protein GT037_004129 [Alternaria burnsii]CAI9636443.1 unnamed protein product [Alternaria burnsii]